MAVLGLLVGAWLMGMGAWGVTHADRSPESPAAHWMSFRSGRRAAGSATIVLGLAIAAASVVWL